MKQYLRIFSMLLLMLIGIGGGDVFGAEATKTSTLTFTQKCVFKQHFHTLLTYIKT